jgi:hypothetical protein
MLHNAGPNLCNKLYQVGELYVFTANEYIL